MAGRSAPRFLTCTNEWMVVPTETRKNGIGEVGDSRTPFLFQLSASRILAGHGDQVLLSDQPREKMPQQGARSIMEVTLSVRCLWTPWI